MKPRHLISNGYDEALEYVNKVLKINPDDYHSYLTKAMILANLGDVLSSLDLLEKAIQGNPKYVKTVSKNTDGVFDNIKSSERFRKLVE